MKAIEKKKDNPIMGLIIMLIFWTTVFYISYQLDERDIAKHKTEENQSPNQ